jgi:FSR family fosmidomycin resistance protein-like MFS transporter
MSSMSTAAVTSFRQDAQVIGLVCVAHSMSHFFQLLLAPLFPWLKVAFNLSYAELGFVVSVFFVVSSISQTLAGFVVDRVGARTVLFAGLGLLGVSALMLSQAQNYAMLMAGAMLGGLGNGVFHPADFTLLNQRVSTPRLSHAFSAHGISGNIGWAIAPLFVATLAGLFSWRVALLAAGIIPLAVLLVLVVYRDLLQTDEVKATVAQPRKEDAVQSKGHVLDFLRVPAVWMCMVFFFITAMAGSGIQTFSIPALSSLYDISFAWATTCFTAYMVASATGMMCGGFLAARTTRHERTIALALSAAGLMAWVTASGIMPSMMAIVLMAAIGFGSGLAGPSRDLLIRAAAPKNATGRVYGVVYSGLDVGMAASPILFGALMDAGHPSWLFIGIGAFQLMAMLTALNVGTKNARKAVKAQAA